MTRAARVVLSTSQKDKGQEGSPNWRKTSNFFEQDAQKTGRTHPVCVVVEVFGYFWEDIVMQNVLVNT